MWWKRTTLGWGESELLNDEWVMEDEDDGLERVGGVVLVEKMFRSDYSPQRPLRMDKSLILQAADRKQVLSLDAQLESWNRRQREHQARISASISAGTKAGMAKITPQQQAEKQERARLWREAREQERKQCEALLEATRRQKREAIERERVEQERQRLEIQRIKYRAAEDRRRQGIALARTAKLQQLAREMANEVGPGASLLERMQKWEAAVRAARERADIS